MRHGKMTTPGRFTLVAITLLMASCTITRPTVTKVTDDYFMVAYPLRYETTDQDYAIIVPVGFLTDLTSIPRGLWWWESPIDRSMAPAIVHDYLYWEQSCSREEADAVLYLALKEAGLGELKSKAIYTAVDKAGSKSWNDNRRAAADGETRFLSRKFALEIQGSDVEPDATLKTIYERAEKVNGLVYPNAANDRVKEACAAASTHYRAHAGP